jgi:large subunit ribosomal protein L5
MDITIVTTATTDAAGKALLDAYGFPFKRGADAGPPPKKVKRTGPPRGAKSAKSPAAAKSAAPKSKKK